MTRYSVALRTRKYVKGYCLLHLSENRKHLFHTGLNALNIQYVEK